MSIVDYNAQKTEQLTKKTWGQGWVVLVVIKYNMADSQGRNKQLLAKNIARVARRQLDTTSAIWRLLAKPKNSLSPWLADKHTLSMTN